MMITIVILILTVLIIAFLVMKFNQRENFMELDYINLPKDMVEQGYVNIDSSRGESPYVEDHLSMKGRKYHGYPYQSGTYEYSPLGANTDKC